MTCKSRSGFPKYEPTEEEIYNVLTKEIQERWTESERQSRGYNDGGGVDGPPIIGRVSCNLDRRSSTVGKD